MLNAVFVVLCVLTTLAAAGFDPCNNYTLLKYTDRRAVQNVLDFGTNTPISDDYLDTGWFRIESDAGEEMPTEPPGSFHCGTWYPIWLNGTIPTVIGEVVTEGVCLQTFQSACEYFWNINIKFCTGTFLVYYLVTSRIASSGYCFGTDAPSTEMEQNSTSTPVATSSGTAGDSTEMEQNSAPDTTSSKEEGEDKDSIKLIVVLLVIITIVISALVVLSILFFQKHRQIQLTGHIVDGKGMQIKINETENRLPPHKEESKTNIPPLNHQDNPPSYRSREPSVDTSGSLIPGLKKGTPVDIFTVNGLIKQN